MPRFVAADPETPATIKVDGGISPAATPSASVKNVKRPPCAAVAYRASPPPPNPIQTLPEASSANERAAAEETTLDVCKPSDVE